MESKFGIIFTNSGEIKKEMFWNFTEHLGSEFGRCTIRNQQINEAQSETAQWDPKQAF